LARSGVGTVIGRRSVSKGRQYERIWIYVPTKVSEDTAFPFKVGDPCLIQLDLDRKQLMIRQISREKAITMGWRMERKRRIG
jgi:hypothetical protein